MNTLEKLEYLRRYDTRYLIFGAQKHRYLLNSVLEEENIADFERRYRVKLPEDYRRFLLFVGNGGAGPGYGLYPLGESDRPGEKEYLSYPFRFDHDVMLDEQDSEFACVCTDCGKCQENDRCYQSDFVDGRYIEGSLYQLGSMTICFEGCTYYRRMILNGPCYGEIWAESEGEGLVRAEGSFSEWYTAWLDRSIETVSPIVRAVESGRPFEEVLAVSGEGIFQFDYSKAEFAAGMLGLQVGAPGADNERYIDQVRTAYERQRSAGRNGGGGNGLP